MGQKINPKLLRLGTVFGWSSLWFEDKRRYKDMLLEDYKLRQALMKKLSPAGVSNVDIERSINSVKLTIYVLRPGMVIGRAGTGMEELKKFLLSIFPKGDGKNTSKLDIRIEPIKEPNLNAYLVAKNISDQLLKRLPAKRVMKQTVSKVMLSGAKGVRVVLSGRIGGAEIGRTEKLQEGTVPLSTIRENINFASVPSLTKRGYIGVKVWINRGDK